MTQMVLETLSHGTPPESTPTNILTVGSLICPNYDIVKELPSAKIIRGCIIVLVVETKTLGAYQIARATRLILHHSNDTSCQGITFGNLISQIEDEQDRRNLALSSVIVAFDGTVESKMVAIEQAFVKCRNLLRNWREVMDAMFPNFQDLVAQIPLPIKLTRACLHNKCWTMTDTCNTPQKFRRLLRGVIIRLAKEENSDITEEEMNVLETDCWHHLRNVWLTAVVTQLGQYLSEVLKEDLETIHFSIRVTTDVNHVLMASEKCFCLQANYVKVKYFSFIFTLFIIYD